MGCTRLGYVNWMELYQGASTHVSEKYKEYGVGAGVVLTYTNALRSKRPDNNFHLFFDNFFSSLHLLNLLTEKNVRGTGTIRKNRLTGNPFPDDKSLKKMNVEHTVQKKPLVILLQFNGMTIIL